jgi:hypothetical protein
LGVYNYWCEKRIPKMASATKATKAGKKENKSALIREHVKANRNATAKEIAEKLGCSEALVHNVRTKMKRGKKKAKRSATTEASAKTHAGISDETSPAELCVTFVRAVGSFAEARKMLMTAEAFSGLKIR